MYSRSQFFFFWFAFQTAFISCGRYLWVGSARNMCSSLGNGWWGGGGGLGEEREIVCLHRGCVKPEGVWFIQNRAF
jgi:hypothetical protein